MCAIALGQCKVLCGNNQHGVCVCVVCVCCECVCAWKCACVHVCVVSVGV